MIVKIEVINDDLYPEGGRERDAVIRAVDRVMKNATWESSGEGWIARA